MNPIYARLCEERGFDPLATRDAFSWWHLRTVAEMRAYFAIRPPIASSLIGQWYG